MPVDTELYDLLGVSPNASEGMGRLSFRVAEGIISVRRRNQEGVSEKGAFTRSCACAAQPIDHIIQAKEHHPVSSPCLQTN